MSELDPRDAALLASHRRNHPRILALAALLICAGLTYTSWAVLRFDPRMPAHMHASFDRPLSSLARLYDAYQPVFRNLQPANDTEQILLRGLRGNMAFSAGMLITLVRVFLGALALLSGLVMITIAYERKRLVQIAERLCAASATPESSDAAAAGAESPTPPLAS